MLPPRIASELADRTDSFGNFHLADGTARSLSYVYDNAGRRTRVTWPDGFHADYDYLLTGELSKVWEYASTTGFLLATYGYDDLGNPTSATYGNGVVQTYGYDGVSRLSNLTTNPSGTANDLTETFAYNPASQITSTTRSNDAYAYTGSATGSIATTTNGLNEMTAVGGVTYANDANGNLGSDGTKAYAHDAENHLKAVTGTGLSAMTSYDPLGRLSQLTGSTISDRTFLQDPVTGTGGDSVVAEYSSGGGLQHRYVPLDGLGAPLVDYDNTGTRGWLMTDERGSVIASANDSGAITTVNAYDEYGIPKSTNVGRFQYAGQMWLSEVSLYSMRNRMYGTQWGRFLETDPIGYSGDGPNLYAYVLNDPVNFVDPWGLSHFNNPPCGSGCTYDPVTGTITAWGTRDSGPPGAFGSGSGSGSFGPGRYAKAGFNINTGLDGGPSPQRANPACTSGRWTLGGQFSATGFLASFGLTGNVEVGVALPTHLSSSWNPFAGVQLYARAQGFGLAGLGFFAGAGVSGVGGVSGSPLTTGIQTSGVVQGGFADPGGGEVSVSFNGNGANGASVSGGPRAGMGGYLAGGAGKTATLATAPLGCPR